MLGASGSAIDWESIARGMIDGTTQFSIGADVAAALEGITTLGRRTFYYRPNLVGDVVLPNSITDLNNIEIFSGCGASSVTIGENCSAINNTVFQYMGVGMKALIINRATPPTLNGATPLSGTPQCIIYVPDEAVEDYKAAQYWSYYANGRIKPISELGGVADYQPLSGWLFTERRAAA